MGVAAPGAYPGMCFGHFETNCSPFEDRNPPVVREAHLEVAEPF